MFRSAVANLLVSSIRSHATKTNLTLNLKRTGLGPTFEKKFDQSRHFSKMAPPSPKRAKIPKTVKDSNLVWVDCEMTGLDPNKDHLIEIAVIVTDKDLNVLAEGPNLVIHQSDEVHPVI